MGLKNDIFTAAGRMGDMLRLMPPFLAKPAQEPSQAEFIDLLETRVQRGRELASLNAHPNWRSFDAELAAREVYLLEVLRSAPLKDVVRIQAQLAEVKFLRQIVPEGIAQGAVALQELTEREAANG